MIQYQTVLNTNVPKYRSTKIDDVKKSSIFKNGIGI